MFYWKPNDKPAPKQFDIYDKNWVEIWNDVFMQYNKTASGLYEPLPKKNVDTGMGTERVIMALQGEQDIFRTDAFKPVMDIIEAIAGKAPDASTIRSFRVIADHLRAATFILGDERGVAPSNVDQGYILRRFIRRAIRHGALLGIHKDFCGRVAAVVIATRGDEWPVLKEKKAFILDELAKEEARFRTTLERGLRQFEKVMAEKPKRIDGVTAFDLFQSYGFPLEMTQELAAEQGITVDADGFNKEYEKHKELSRVGAEKKFKGGLADTGEMTTKLHTATHLLNEALRHVISKDIVQKGSNITPERLRFDFNFGRKLTPDEVKKVEAEVNRVIKAAMVVTRSEMTPDEAKKQGAQAEFGVRYPDKVSVYKIGNYSMEICMGPHVKNTKELGTFKIIKEEASAAGIRRIKAVVE
jgi:alanyl-tRNA synthetase